MEQACLLSELSNKAPQQLKSLRKNINNLEAKLEQLSPTNNIYKPLKDITKQLEVLLGLYIKGIIND